MSKMLGKESRKVLLTHIFFFSLFLVVPILVFPRPPGIPFFPLTRAFIQDTIANCTLLGFFYANYYILIPKFYFNQKYVKYVICVVICLTVVLLLPELLKGPFSGMVQDPPPDVAAGHGNNIPHPLHSRPFLFFVWDGLRHHLYLFFTAIFFSFLLRVREHLNQVKEEKLKAEIASLKAQINPHFLFNVLHNIYTLSVKKDDKASDAIIHLSGIMRYAINDANDAKIPLLKEIEYIQNYIELQKSRLGNTATVMYDCSGQPGNKEIAPLILITYIENVFKHGINPEVEDCSVEIKLQITGTGIRLYTFNKKVPHPLDSASTGIGMSNTLARIKHLYPDKHDLQISGNNGTYSVTLSLELV